MFFTYKQNNIGGYFCEPAIFVIIEADNIDLANKIAEKNDIYFDGCEKCIDCQCCGDRWRRPDKGSATPLIYGKEIKDCEETIEWYSDFANDIPTIMIIYSNGSVVTIKEILDE